MARKPIVQRIALEGGDGIKAQLLALGKTGEAAFKAIQAAASKADFQKFAANLSRVRSDLATVGRNLTLLGTGLAAAAGGATAAVIGLAKSGAEAADAAGKNAQKVGLQVDAYGRLEFAAKQADVGQDQLVAGMSKLNKAIAEAATGTDKAADAIDASGVNVIRFGANAKKAADAAKPIGNIFTRLGVSIKDANGKLRSNEAILQDVAEAFARMPDGALKSALAIELFGKAGAELIPFLNQGRDGIRDLGKEAEKLGLIFTPAEAALGDKLGDTLDSLAGAVSGIRKKLGILFAPIVLVGAEAFRDLIVENKDAILQFGAAAARVTAGVLRDLLRVFSGNVENVKNPWIREWSIAIIQFGSDIKGVFDGLVLPAFKALRAGAQFVADQLNKIFGTNITAGELALGAAILSAVGAFTLLGSAIGAVVAGIGLLAGLVGGIPLAIAAAAVTAGVLIGVFWNQITAGAAAAWQFIQDGAGAAWAAIVDGATGLWAQIVGAFQAGQQMAVDAFNAVVASIIELWTAASNRLGQIATEGVQLITNAFNGLKERIAGIWNAIADTARSAFSRIGGFIDNMISRISAAIARLKELVGLGKSAGSGGGGGSQGFASGGAVRGPGGPRTDSILARLSNGEFVIQAKIVKQLGVDFFHRLNSGFLPSMEGLRGFNMGGVVDGFNRSMSQLSIPRYATGGLAAAAAAPKGSGSTGLTTVRLDFGLGPQDVFDLIGEGHVVEKLHRFAIRSGLNSTGRKPRRS